MSNLEEQEEQLNENENSQPYVDESEYITMMQEDRERALLRDYEQMCDEEERYYARMHEDYMRSENEGLIREFDVPFDEDRTCFIRRGNDEAQPGTSGELHSDVQENRVKRCFVCERGSLTIRGNEIVCVACNFHVRAIYSISEFQRNIERLKINHSGVCGGSVRFLTLFEISDPQQKFCMICETCKKFYVIM